MKNKLSKFLMITLIILLNSVAAYALPPVLFFSDITSGPSTGNGDGLGSGAIVTIWGANLGPSQGKSTVAVSGIPTDHVYCWGNADGSTCGGPAQLYTYQKMQAISFSIPPGATLGANTISVTVGGITSKNTLPFTVRSGRICYVKTTGTDVAGNCSFSSPWQTLPYVSNSATVNPGDIIYVMNGVSAGPTGWGITTSGTQANPIAYVAYPGASVSITGNGVGIGNANASRQWVIFSKFKVMTNGTGIDAFFGGRFIGNEITNNVCADGQAGAISGSGVSQMSGGGIKVYGNYIHDFGCDSTAKLHHVFYISNRSGVTLQSYEIGWNYLINNKAWGALHNYDEGVCGDWTGNMLEHDNVIINQRAGGMDVATGNPYSGSICMSQPIYFYNNLFINTGQDSSDPTGAHSQAVAFGGQLPGNLYSNIYVYNNTFYGYGDPTNKVGAFFQTCCANYPFHVYWQNNLVVDTLNLPFLDPVYFYDIPTVHTNNLWYSSFGQKAPSWDTSPITSNLSLVNPVIGGSFIPQQSSWAVNTGTDTSPIVTLDLRGVSRGMSGTAYDIGAFEFITMVAPSAPISLLVK